MKKRCCFCRATLDHHAAILGDGYASACITTKDKLTEEKRNKYKDRLNGAWREWGRAFEGFSDEGMKK